MGNKIYVGGKRKRPAGRRYRPHGRGGLPAGGIAASVLIALAVVVVVVLFATGVFKVPGSDEPVLPKPENSSSMPEQSAAPETSTPVSQAPAVSQGEVNSRVTDPSLAYQLLYPELYVDPTEIIPRTEGDQVVYLTFNDAPSSGTEELLRLLDRLQVKATFFVTSANAQDAACRELLKSMADRGHTIGIYSYSGDFSEIYSSVEAYLEDFKKCDDLIFDATGRHASLFRFPAGSGDNSYNNGLSEELIAEMTRRGYVYHDWNVDSSDVSGSMSADAIAQNTLDGCRAFEKNVVLLNNAGHNETTTQAVEKAVLALKEEGYRFAALDPSVKPFVF